MCLLNRLISFRIVIMSLTVISQDHGMIIIRADVGNYLLYELLVVDHLVD